MELPRNGPSLGFEKKRKVEVSALLAVKANRHAVKVELYSLRKGYGVTADLRLEPNEAEDLAAMLMYYAQEARNASS